MPDLTARDILKLLAVKHAKDVFVPECKTGPSYPSPPRLDAWVMRKTWVNTRFIGYEIKVSRSDFVGDDKWRTYLDYCEELWFCCPHGLIQPDELPGDCGLLWVSKTGSRLYTKKKAPSRKIEDSQKLNDLVAYILMHRIRVTKEFCENDRTYWEQWLVDKTVDQEFGRRVGAAIQERVGQEIIAARSQSAKLRTELEGYATVVRWCKQHSIPVGWDWSTRDRLDKLLAEANGNGLAGEMKFLAEKLGELSGRIDGGDA